MLFEQNTQQLQNIVQTKKSAKLKKSNQTRAVWEKRQMGNVLLIVIFVIRICLAELSSSKVHFIFKNSHLLAGPASTL